MVQSAERAATGGGQIWKTAESVELTRLQNLGKVDEIIIHVIQ